MLALPAISILIIVVIGVRVCTMSGMTSNTNTNRKNDASIRANKKNDDNRPQDEIFDGEDEPLADNDPNTSSNDSPNNSSKRNNKDVMIDPIPPRHRSSQAVSSAPRPSQVVAGTPLKRNVASNGKKSKD
mmetsp:Transcript_28704/g.37086  ORF Transcript_28704/g.37086 Transcript_28704/m.37086 type:complete len:130 (-) Transcript_28704:307-696(-)